MLKKRNEYLEKNVPYSLVLDEMRIRKYVEKIIGKTYRVIDLGISITKIWVLLEKLSYSCYWI